MPPLVIHNHSGKTHRDVIELASCDEVVANFVDLFNVWRDTVVIKCDRLGLDHQLMTDFAEVGMVFVQVAVDELQEFIFVQVIGDSVGTEHE